jgi:hypothetical protein
MSDDKTESGYASKNDSKKWVLKFFEEFPKKYV